MVDLLALKDLAEKATPGPWYHCQPFMRVSTTQTIHGRVLGQRVDFVAREADPPHRAAIIPMEQRESNTKSNDMAFIAAANPAVVLELIAEIQSLRAQMRGDDDMEPMIRFFRED